MTLVVAWIGVDSRKVTSAYIATDSRITWPTKPITQYDNAIKTFSFKKTADIVGFSGEVLFPTMILSQIKELADEGLLFSPEDSPCVRSDIIQRYVIEHYRRYPEKWFAPINIIHIGREYDKPNFYCRVISHDKNGDWTKQEVKLPEESGVVYIDGSGKSAFQSYYEEFQKTHNHNTSRNVFHSFCYTLANPKDDSYGGSPQLVGIYAKQASTSKTFGIIHDNKLYYMGAQLSAVQGESNIEWRNDYFEICDGITKKKMPKAARQRYDINKLATP